MDREWVDSRTRERHQGRPLAITRAFFRRELCVWPHSALSPLDNATGKARNISRPRAASKWGAYASHNLPSFRAKSKNHVGKSKGNAARSFDFARDDRLSAPE